MRTCLLTCSWTVASKDRTIYLFRIYRIETPFVAAFLKERNAKVHLITSSSPLSFYHRVLIGDSVKVNHPYQVDEFKYYRELGTCTSCELWSPETFYRLEARYKGLAIQEYSDVIGVYTQGFLLREKLGTIHSHFAAGAIRREYELLETIAIYAKNHPNVSIIIFPHPMERRYYEETGEHQFDSLESYANVEIDLPGSVDSMLQFNRVGLGLTTFSSIGFERIYMGLRTLFYVSDLPYVNWDIPSSYNKLFFTKQEDFLSAIDWVRNISHQEFMAKYFGEAFLPGFWSMEKHGD